MGIYADTLKALNMTQSELARSLKISRFALHQRLKSKRRVNERQLKQLCQIYKAHGQAGKLKAVLKSEQKRQVEQINRIFQSLT